MSHDQFLSLKCILCRISEKFAGRPRWFSNLQLCFKIWFSSLHRNLFYCKEYTEIYKYHWFLWVMYRIKKIINKHDAQAKKHCRGKVRYSIWAFTFKQLSGWCGLISYVIFHITYAFSCISRTKLKVLIFFTNSDPVFTTGIAWYTSL